MSFWSFIRRLIIIDWFFGGHGNRSQCSSNNDDCQHDDNYLNNGYHYGGYDNAAGQDYGDPFDSGLPDNDYGSGLFSDDPFDSGMSGNDYGSGLFGDDPFDSGMSGNDF